MSRTYKQSEHFKTCLHRFQALEQHGPPTELLEKIHENLNGDEPTYYNVRYILRKLGKIKWLDSADPITRLLKGEPLPVLTEDEKDELIKQYDYFSHNCNYARLANQAIQAQCEKRRDENIHLN
jgi:hypothetical protein